MVSDKAVDSSSIQDLLQSLDSEPESVARDHFKRFIEDASQPRHISGNACIKLCYFLEQCRKSKSCSLRSLAYSRETCQDLFDFYVEWNEKNQHRSMRQVLELLASLISLNPDKTAANDFKLEALNRLISIITHQSAQPLVKPAFKMLEYFLSKGTFDLSELFEVYSHVCGNGDSILYSAQETQNDIQWDRFVSGVFEWMSLPDTSSAAGKLLVSLFGALKTSPIGKSEVSRSYSAYWQRWIQQGLGKHPESLENVKNYLFPPLFKLDRLGSLEFLRNLSEHNPIDSIGSQEVDSHASLLLSAMEVGKKLGLVDDPDIFPPQKASAKKRDFVALPSKVIGDLLKHTASSVRSSAFSVLVLSLSSTKPFPSESLDVIHQNLYILHADTDAKFRNELFTNTKYMLERLRGALALLNREIGLNAAKEQALSNGTSTAEEIGRKGEDLLKHVQEHNKFLYWYLDFLAQELVPTASYQRHITSLKSLEILLKTGVQASSSISALSTSHGSDTSWPQQINIFSPSLVRLLLDLVLDPFEEVRNSSVSVLNFAPKESFGPLIDTSYGSVPQLLQDLVSKAKMASSQTGRADIADGLAHTFVLEFKFLGTNQQRLQLFELLLSALEGDVLGASKDLETASYTAPIHGQLATMRQLWQLISPDSYEGIVAKNTDSSDLTDWTIHTLQDRLVKCCVNIWDVVKGVLCNDSPEGHIPKSSENLTDTDVKNVLSYSFRACHESSLLIQAIVSKLTVKSSKESPFLTFNSFQQVGNLTFEQLSTLRHRGAFSTVAGTFTQCCKLTQHASIVENGGAALLLDWYNGALACIDEQNSTTRRSAGIPALMTGILSASSPVVTFDSVMQKLQSTARAPVIDTGRDEVQLSQVHAMNSLKDIFKSATLGKQADIYVTDCFLIAADSLKSKIWAISNCGLLLIKSLMDCMLGTSESKEATEAGWDGRSIRISYDRYPKLPELLLRLLSSEIKDSTDAKEIFPALEFVRRVGPPEKDRTQFREKFFAHVIKHLNCSTWDVRDLAARTACTFLLDDDWVTTIVELLNANQSSTNWLYGVLLLIKYLMQKRHDLDKITTTDDLLEVLKAMSFICLKHGEYPTDGILLASYEESLFPIYAIILKTSPPQTHAIHDFLGSNSESPTTILDAIFASINEMRARNPEFSADASLSKVYALHYIYVLRLENRLQDLIKGTLHWSIDEMDSDLAVEILDKILTILDLETLSTEDRIDLVGFFHKFRRVSWPGRVQASALRCISVVLGFTNYASLTDGQIRQLLEWLANPLFLGIDDMHMEMINGFLVSVINSPDLENAIIQAKGSIFRLKIHAYERQLLSSDPVVGKEELSDQIFKFGKDVLYALSNDQDFDARLSALEAIQYFYSFNSHFALFLPALLFVNLALLSSLSDDDDDIRRLGALTVSNLTMKSEVPEAAAERFAVWMCRNYQSDENFSTAVMRKVTTGKGQCQVRPYNNVEDELADALIEDNSLFIEEDQNLYIDEVREAQMWIKMLMCGEGEHWEDAQAYVSLWSYIGLCAIERQAAERIDGPFGWTSRPQVFAICARVILAARAESALLETVEEEDEDEVVRIDLLRVGRRLWEVGSKNDFHPLLLEKLQWFADTANVLGIEDEEE